VHASEEANRLAGSEPVKRGLQYYKSDVIKIDKMKIVGLYLDVWQIFPFDRQEQKAF
jgi:hypothetical protein